MAQPQFLPFLTDDQGRSLINDGGNVVTRPIPTWQEDSPEGWEENIIQYSRNVEFLGMIKAYVTNLKFFLDSAFILRDWYYRKGIEAVMFFIWLKLDQNFGGGMIHKGWYKGEIDFGTFKDHEDGVEVNITEGGFYKDLNANKNIPYTYSFKDEETVSLEMDGMHIYYQTKFFINNGIDVTDPNYNLSSHLIDLVTLSNEFENVGSVGPVERTKVANNNATIRATGKYFLHATTSGDVNIKYKFTVTNTFYTPPGLNPAAEWFVVIRCIDSAGLFKSQHVCITKDDTNMEGTFNVQGSTDIAVDNDDELYFYCFMTVAGATGDAQMQFDWSGDDSIFEVNFKFRKPLTVIPAFTVYDLGNKFVKSMSSNRSTLSGSFLSNDQNLLCTSFDGIRGIRDSGMKGTFIDYYKSVDAVKCITMDVVNNNPVISSRYDKFNNTSISSLGECRKPLIEVAEDMIYDSVEAGYPEKDIDDVNGKFSFANGYTWKGPIKRIKNTYVAKSNYVADPFVIEIARVKLEGKNTTDNRMDKDCAFIDAEKVYPDFTGDIEFTAPSQVKLIALIGLSLKENTRFRVMNGSNMATYTVLRADELTGNTVIQVFENVITEAITTTIEFRHYKLRRLAYTITGIPNGDTVFNIELTAMRNLRNHFRWLRSSWEHMDSSFMTFQATDKNADLVTDDGAGTIISEKANVLIGTMGPRVWLPHYINIEIQSPYNLKELMDVNNSGYFNFLFNGLDLQGYPWDIKTNDTTLSTQQYKLLSTANNDLTQLIKNR